MSDETGVDPELVASVEKFFENSVGPALAEFDRTGALPAQLWASTEELGLTLVAISEELGGSGGSLPDLLAILMSASRHAVPLPLMETHLAAWLLTNAGAEVPSGPMTVVASTAGDSLRVADGTLFGNARDVAWAPSVSRVVALADDPDGVAHVVAFDPSECFARSGQDLAGQPTASLEVAQPALVCLPAPFTGERYAWYAALVAAAQLAGTLEAVAAITQHYSQERVQFGKPIASFQAVQQHLVTLAQAAELATMSVWRAARAHAERPASFEVCAAKLVANESARISVRAAHQAHGAIGMTREYALHHYTRRLNLWRQQFGTERQLAAALGKAVRTAPSFAHALSDHDNSLEVACPMI